MDSVEVSSADIARLAGVRPTAVSNWRRRHTDFPAPVGGTEKSPRFSLDEVRDWLVRQGRSVDVGPRRELAQAVSAAAATTPAADTLRNALFALLYHQDDESADEQRWHRRLTADASALGQRQPGLDGRADIGDIDTAQATMLNMAIGADASVRDLAAELYSEVVGRRLGAGDAATPTELAKLMVQLADPGAGPLLDPACGAGTVLMAAAEYGCLELRGIERNRARAQLAALRLEAAFSGRINASIANANALNTDPMGSGKASAVVSFPPFNDRTWAQGVPDDASQWPYGLPSSRESELAWLQRALPHLRPGGTAVLVMPPGAAFRASGRRIRRGLLGDGLVQAVIGLPPGSLHGTAIAPHLWLLRGEARPSAEHAVLTADFSAYATADRKPDWSRIEAAATAAWEAYRLGKAPAGPDANRTSVMAIFEGNVDLTPGRYLPVRLSTNDIRDFEQQRQVLTGLTERLSTGLRDLPDRVPELEESVRWESIEALEASADLSLHRGLQAVPDEGAEAVRLVRAYGPAREQYAEVEPGQQVTVIREGDLLAAIVGSRIEVRMAGPDDFHAAPHWTTVVIRTDPRRIDPGFLAGFLAGTLTEQQLSRVSSSTGLNALRDLRRLRVALPSLHDQQRYAELFTSLAAVADAAATVAASAEALARARRDDAWVAILGPEPAI